MTQDEIIEMLRASCEKDRVDPEQNGFWVIVTEELEAFAKLVEEKAIKEALSQPEQEPVAWITPDGEGFRIRFSPPVNDVPLGWDALYTTQPQRKPMTYEEIEDLYFKFSMGELKDLPETLKPPTTLRSKT